MYRIARHALFATDPESAHALTLQGLKLAHQLGAMRWLCPTRSIPVECMGLRFPNPVGVAAGLDKNADYFEALGDLGFGFVEVGTVTPRPQAGNPKPRVFRLPESEALINRLGFNNKGVDYLVERVRKHRFRGILGINIGKNAVTPIENAGDDYVHCLERVYPHAGYVTINISSPNTSNLRELQGPNHLDALLQRIATTRTALAKRFSRRVPIAVKVAPDLDAAQIAHIAANVVQHGLDGVIATNTTITRPGLETSDTSKEAGGLSGAPLKPMADAVLANFRRHLPRGIALIGVGGISHGGDAVDKLRLGADLVQFYTGMIYRGPALVSDCLEAVQQHLRP